VHVAHPARAAGRHHRRRDRPLARHREIDALAQLEAAPGSRPFDHGPAGRRGRGLHLTPKGEAVIKQAYPVWMNAQSKTITIMGAQSRSTLDDLLVQAEKLAA